MKDLVIETERAWQALGTVRYGGTEVEKTSLKFRRSLYVAKDIKVGEVFTSENLRIIRLGHGLQPKFFGDFIGKTTNRDLLVGAPISREFI